MFTLFLLFIFSIGFPPIAVSLSLIANDRTKCQPTSWVLEKVISCYRSSFSVSIKRLQLDNAIVHT